MIRKIFAVLVCVFSLSLAPQASAQDYDYFVTQYNKAHDLFNQKKYELAIEAFVPLMTDHVKNPFKPYALYFTGLSSYYTKQYDQGRLALVELLQKYNGWDHQSMVFYVLGNISFEKKEYDQAMADLGNVTDSALQTDVDGMKYRYLSCVKGIDTLKYLYNDYPSDVPLARVLAHKLYGNAQGDDVYLLQQIVNDYGLPAYLLDKPKTTVNIIKEKKDSYNIALLMTINEKASTGNDVLADSYAADMYIGMLIAADSLKAQGIKVNIFTYNMGADSLSATKTMMLPEMKSMDLLIGPAYASQSPIVADFAEENGIIMINPLSNTTFRYTKNPYAYQFKPGFTTLGESIAQMAHEKFKPMRAVVLYAPNRGDSLIAAAFKKRYEALGGRVVMMASGGDKGIHIPKKLNKRMLDTCGFLLYCTTTQYDLGSLLRTLGELKSNITVIGFSEWLYFGSVAFDQYRYHNMHFVFQVMKNYGSEPLTGFNRAFYDRTNKYPSDFACTGYDLLRIVGVLLNEYGPDFREAIEKKGYLKGYSLQGLIFGDKHDNQWVPIVTFTDEGYEIVNKPEIPKKKP